MKVPMKGCKGARESLSGTLKLLAINSHGHPNCMSSRCVVIAHRSYIDEASRLIKVMSNLASRINPQIDSPATVLSSLIFDVSDQHPT